MSRLAQLSEVEIEERFRMAVRQCLAEAGGARHPGLRLLDAAGLNLQAVFNIADLPPPLRAQIETAGHFRQLILIGHGGRRLWEAVQASGIVSADPIDEFSVRTVEAWLAECLPGARHAVIYPGPQPVGLQKLGELASWHHPSPFMVGINAAWGSWYAYRVVLLVDSDFAPTPPLRDVSPCLACPGRDCISACPAGALGGDVFSLEKCLAWRQQPGSSCRTRCLARLACPVGSEHRYAVEQMEHSYGISLRMILETSVDRLSISGEPHGH